MSVPIHDIKKSIVEFYLLLEMENERLKEAINETIDEFHFCWLWCYVIKRSFTEGETSTVPHFNYLNGQVTKFYWLSLLSVLRGQTVQFGHVFRQFTESARFSAFAITWPEDIRLAAIGDSKDAKAKMFSQLETKYPDEVKEMKKITDSIQTLTHVSIHHLFLNKTYDDVTDTHGITFTDQQNPSEIKAELAMLGVFGAKYVSMLMKSPNKDLIKYDDYTARLITIFLTIQTNQYIDKYLNPAK